MKRFTATFLALFLCFSAFLLTSCTEKAEFYDLAVCGSYAVPGMFCNELKGGTVSCDVVEKDAYGRLLFAYTTYSNLTNREETAYVVCQKYDADYVYFYEDIGYLFAADYAHDAAHLKSRNDWDMPLDETKMSRRKNKVTVDLCIAKDTDQRWSNTEKACAEVLGIEPAKIEPYGFVDSDANGHEITLIRCGDEQSDAYFTMTLTDGTASVLKIADQTINQAQLTAWKHECGWVYGFANEG